MAKPLLHVNIFPQNDIYKTATTGNWEGKDKEEKISTIDEQYVKRFP